METNVDLRMNLTKIAQDTREEIAAERVDKGEFEHRRFSRSMQPRLFFCRIDFAQDAVGMAQQTLSLGRQFDLSVAALEEMHAEFLLQF